MESQPLLIFQRSQVKQYISARRQLHGEDWRLWPGHRQDQVDRQRPVQTTIRLHTLDGA